MRGLTNWAGVSSGVLLIKGYLRGFLQGLP